MKIKLILLIIATLAISLNSCKSKPKYENNTVTDADGNTYRTIRIGNQIWMAENLRVKRYQNGDPIKFEIDDNTWDNLKDGAFTWVGCDDGLLYNWYAVNDSRNIAPIGWRVATDNDFAYIKSYISKQGNLFNSNPCCKLRQNRPSAWKEYKTTGNVHGGSSGWWSATQYQNGYYIIRFVEKNTYVLNASVYFKNDGLSVLCVKN